jgi:hypothetical protein
MARIALSVLGERELDSALRRGEHWDRGVGAFGARSPKPYLRGHVTGPREGARVPGLGGCARESYRLIEPVITITLRSGSIDQSALLLYTPDLRERRAIVSPKTGDRISASGGI